MKPFFGNDRTTDKKNDYMNAEPFLVATPPAQASRMQELSGEAVDETIRESRLPLFARIFTWICGYLALICLGGLVWEGLVWERVPIRTAYANAPQLFWVGGVCLVLFVLLLILGHRKQKAVLESEDADRYVDRLVETTNDVFSQLGVPETAEEVNALGFFYRVKKDGEVRPCKGFAMQLALYFNYTFRAYVDGERFCLANLEGVYAVPLAELKAIRTVRKRIALSQWVKDDPITDEKYKPYKLGMDRYGTVYAKEYHVLEFEHEGEAWGIWFPNYDLPAYEKLTGLKAEE